MADKPATPPKNKPTFLGDLLRQFASDIAQPAPAPAPPTPQSENDLPKKYEPMTTGQPDGLMQTLMNLFMPKTQPTQPMEQKK